MLRNGRRLLLAGISLTILAVFAVGIWCVTRPAVEVPPADRGVVNGGGVQVPESSELPPLSAVRFLNAAPGVGFINSEACAKCHAEKAGSFFETGHARALSSIDLAHEPPDGEVYHQASGRRYKIVRRDGALHHQEFLSGDASSGTADRLLSDYAVSHAIGSGRHTRSYFVEKNGFACESPVTWYQRGAEWRMSPGYDHPRQSGFDRSINFECINCHAGRVELVDNTLKKFRLHEQRIGCERCHGPGELHAKAHRAHPDASSGAPDNTIVHPGRLSRGLTESICAQCHLSTLATVDLRGRSITDFRPGRPLEEFRVHFREQADESSDKMTVVGHVEQMHASQCYAKSETLTCTTCHNPHASVSAEKRVQHYRSKCLTCHQGQEPCAVPLPKRQLTSKADDCTICHMPRGQTEIPHIAFAHHRIGIHSPQTGPQPAAEELRSLTPLEDLSKLPALERDRLLGLAWLRAGWKQSTPDRVRGAFERARPILENVVSRGLRDGVVEAGLAQIAMERQDSEEAILRSRAALGSPGIPQLERDVAWWALGHSLLREGRVDEAEPILKKLTSVQFECNDWYALGRVQYQQKKTAEALQSVQNAALADPSRLDVQETLLKMYRALNRSEEAARQLIRVQQIQAWKASMQKE